MDVEARRLLAGVFLYVAMIGGAVATLGAAFAEIQPGQTASSTAPAPDDSRVTVATNR